jgi:hypothetical protein
MLELLFLNGNEWIYTLLITMHHENSHYWVVYVQLLDFSVNAVRRYKTSMLSNLSSF